MVWPVYAQVASLNLECANDVANHTWPLQSSKAQPEAHEPFGTQAESMMHEFVPGARRWTVSDPSGPGMKCSIGIPFRDKMPGICGTNSQPPSHQRVVVLGW